MCSLSVCVVCVCEFFCVRCVCGLCLRGFVGVCVCVCVVGIFVCELPMCNCFSECLCCSFVMCECVVCFYVLGCGICALCVYV